MITIESYKTKIHKIESEEAFFRINTMGRHSVQDFKCELKSLENICNEDEAEVGLEFYFLAVENDKNNSVGFSFVKEPVIEFL